MTTVALLFGWVGIFCIVSKRDLIGVISGLLILFWGVSVAFVVAGARGAAPESAQAVAAFVSVCVVIQLVLGLAMAVRLYYVKRTIEVDRFKELKE